MHYTVDEELKMEYVKFLLKESCKRKFLSECAGYNETPPLCIFGFDGKFG